MSEQDLQEIIRKNQKEIEGKDFTIEILTHRSEHLERKLEWLRKDIDSLNTELNQKRINEEKAEQQKFLFTVLSAIRKMELIKEEGKPSNITPKDWSQKDEKNKWMVLYQTSNSKRFIARRPELSEFLELARAATDAESFSDAMTVISEQLDQCISNFVEKRELLSFSWNKLEEQLYQYLLSNRGESTPQLQALFLRYGRELGWQPRLEVPPKVPNLSSSTYARSCTKDEIPPSAVVGFKQQGL